MSSNYNYAGVIQPPKTVALTTANKTDLTSITGKALYKLVALTVANSDATNATTIELYWNDGTTDSLFWYDEVAAKKSIIITDFPIALAVGLGAGNPAKLVGKAGAANRLTISVLLSAETTQVNSGG